MEKQLQDKRILRWPAHDSSHFWFATALLDRGVKLGGEVPIKVDVVGIASEI